MSNGWRAVGELAAATAAFSLLYSGYRAVHSEALPSDVQRIVAAQNIAQRYVCKIVGVDDTGRQPNSSETRDSTSRTTVKVTTDIQDREGIKATLKKYPTPYSAISWVVPIVFGEMRGPYAPETALSNQNPLTEQGLTNNGTDSVGQMTVSLYPRRNAHPEGSIADIWIENGVDTDMPNGKGIMTTYGNEWCGSLLFKDNQWEILPTGSPPAITQYNSVEVSP
jgi:hypothetical protein